MYNISELQEIVQSQFAKLDFQKQPTELYKPIEYILSIGGKRIRPLFTLMACNIFSDEIEKAFNPAIGLEVFHNFTLLHDDIMDNADIRRGQPTVHKKWNENTAILSGDAMMIYAYEFFFSLPANIQQEVLKVFNQTALEVCEGQQYDMNFETRLDVSEEEYIEMIKLKTSVLIAACMKIGAVCGGANEKDAQLMYDFGLSLGLAFQLRDDYLDSFGETSVFGKEVGGDIVANKKTYLLIKALSLSNKQKKSELLHWVNLNVFEREEKVNKVTEIYNSLDIKQITEQKINEYYNLAFNYLNEVSALKENKTVLLDFVKQLKNRDK